MAWMTYDEVAMLILAAIAQRGGGFIRVSPDLRLFKESLGFLAGINCNSRGWDVWERSWEMHNQGIIIRRYKLGRRVFFVLSDQQSIGQLLAAHPRAVMQTS
jgi:hypothetical protein